LEELEFEITLERFSFYAVIGILEKERVLPQKVEVEATFRYKGEFVDYALVAKLIKKHLQEGRFYLIEEALSSTLTLLKNRFPQLTYGKLTLKKPQILDDVVPGVTLSLNFS